MERWIDKLKSNPPSVDMGIQPSESLPPESNAPWLTWKTLNGLRSGVDRTKASIKKWAYHTGDPLCNCGTKTAPYSCCICLSCMVKIGTCQQIRSSHEQCLSDHHRLFQTYQHQQPTSTCWYCTTHTNDGTPTAMPTAQDILLL